MLHHSLGVLLLFSMLPSPGIPWEVERRSVRNVAEYLNENCVDFASFIPPVCKAEPLGTTCCALFSVVGICSPSCSKKSASSMFQLESLQFDVALCAGLRQTEKSMCSDSERSSERCRRLSCFSSMMCIPSYDFSCHTNRHLVATDGGSKDCASKKDLKKTLRQRHSFIRDNCYGLPEIADSESTGLVSEDDSELSEVKPDDAPMQCTDPDKLRYRTIDGSCNNLENPKWGKSFEPQIRLLRAVYSDGENLPRITAKSGKPLPLARVVSTKVTASGDAFTSVTNMVMAWGQFIDHDLSGTATVKNGTKTLKCCDDIPDELLVKNGGPCDPIEVPVKDVLGVRCMNFARSLPVTFPNGTQRSPREQTNALTSYLDGSCVYGSIQKELDNLKGKDGKMKVTEMNMLPENKKGTCKKEKEGDYCMLAGDKRVNVFVGLVLLHTSFIREHNRIATAFRKLNPYWNDEKIFQETRRIISAQLQRITYAAWIPLLLDKPTIKKNRLAEGNFRYDPKLDASISNVFSTAAFRYGHSQITHLVKIDNVTRKMQDTLMRPGAAMDNLAGVARGLISKHTDVTDRFFASGLINNLFEKSPGVGGLDLVAVNIQRGRDHGLQGYNAYRKLCGLKPIKDFKSPELTTDLSVVYGDMDDVDIFVGLVVEKTSKGSLMGPTLNCLLADQFKALKEGDRFFYETSSSQEGFTKAQLSEIKKVTLAKILCENIGMDKIQTNVFKLPLRNWNPDKSCADLPAMDLKKWKAAN
ncbi:hypothetical protein ACOMHN_012539 [Nucella lapillus]